VPPTVRLRGRTLTRHCFPVQAAQRTPSAHHGVETLSSVAFHGADGSTNNKAFCESVARHELLSEEPPKPSDDHMAWRLHKAAMYINDAKKGQQLRPHRATSVWRLADSLFNASAFNVVLALAVFAHMLLGFLDAPSHRDWQNRFYVDRVPWLLGAEWAVVLVYLVEPVWLLADLRWRFFRNPARLLQLLLIAAFLADLALASILLPAGTNYVRWSRPIRPFLLLFRSRLLLRMFSIAVRVVPAAAEIIHLIVGGCSARPARAVP
jgi:hypothetical protein